jgi:hypothetical protein
MAASAPDNLPNPADYTDPSPNPGQDAALAVLCDQLQERGVTRAVLHYAGRDGDGSVGEIDFLPTPAAVPDVVDEALGALAGSYCPVGFASDEGGYGTLTLWPFLGLAERRHHNRNEGTEDLKVGATALPEGLRQQLAQAGIRAITSCFDGCCAIGEFEEHTVQPDGGVLPDALGDELKGFLREQLPDSWAVNAGSFGTFWVEVASGAVAVEGYARVTREAEAVRMRWRWRE